MSTPAPITSRECMIGKRDGVGPSCISAKNHGKFVFVTGGRVFQISNQDFADSPRACGITRSS